MPPLTNLDEVTLRLVEISSGINQNELRSPILRINHSCQDIIHSREHILGNVFDQVLQH
jgi:hypothetical protein